MLLLLLYCLGVSGRVRDNAVRKREFHIAQIICQNILWCACWDFQGFNPDSTEDDDGGSRSGEDDDTEEAVEKDNINNNRVKDNKYVWGTEVLHVPDLSLATFTSEPWR